MMLRLPIAAMLAFAAATTEPLFGLVAPQMYDPVPVGVVKPSGWLEAQLVAQAKGIGSRWLGGGARINTSKWVGGSGTHVWPGAQAYPYWLNGAVPLAAALDDPELTAEVVRQFRYVLDQAATPAADGWLGPLDLIDKWETGRCNDKGPDINGTSRFSTEFRTQRCHWFASIEASMRMTNGMLLVYVLAVPLSSVHCLLPLPP
jgi:hypothetical protein